jgi:hypothetical protein
MIFAADAIPEVAEDDPTYRAGKETNPERGECGQGPRRLTELREEQRGEHQRRRRAVDEEVVPLDGGAYEARQRDLPDSGDLPAILPS